MRYSIFAAGLVAIGAAAQAQAPGWNYFETDEGLVQAFVQSDDGAQLILKCDKPGKREVYAVVVSPVALVPPRTSFIERTAALRFDGGIPDEVTLRYYETSVLMVNTRRERSLKRLLDGIDDASTFEMRLEGVQSKQVQVNFDVAGAADAIARVFESCKDEIP